MTGSVNEKSVTVRGLVKYYGDVPAIDGIGFEVDAGSIVTILGPSGCGKTTTLRCIAGLEMPTSGFIKIGDVVVYDGSKSLFLQPERRNLGMVFQSYAIWPHMTVGENVGFPLKVARMPQRERSIRIDRILDLVGLAEMARRPATDLSGGQQQRVALARSLIYKPQLVLFDEPLSNLDANLRERMRSEIRALQDELQFTAIFVTHDQDEAFSLADQVIVMRDGSIEQIGSPENVIRDPCSLFTAEFLGYSNLFKGRVAKINNDATVTVNLDVGISTNSNWRSPEAAQVGEPAVVAFRKDQIDLLPSNEVESASGSSARGHIVLASMLGTRMRYRVQIGSLAVSVENADGAKLRRGDPVDVVLDQFGSFAYRP